MPQVKVLRPTVIQGQARSVGDVLDITSQDMHILGRRVEVIKASVDDEESEPETATNTTAMHSSLIAGARTAKRK